MVVDQSSVRRSSTHQLIRPRFFQRQVVTAQDLTTGQEYLLDRLRRHNRYLHGCGVVCGLEVFLDTPGAKIPSVTVTAGYALSPEGDEISVAADTTVPLDCIEDVAGDCKQLDSVPAGQQVYIAVRYQEKKTRAVAALRDPCAPVATCEFSRFEAGYEIKCFDQLPPTCLPISVDCRTVLEDLLQSRRTAPETPEDISGLFACPPEPDGPWVVLACLDVDAEGVITVDYSPRTQILSTRSMTEMIRCLFSAAPTRFQLYLDRADEYRWRLLSGLDEIIADSGEGFVTRDECNAEILLIRQSAGGAAIEDITAVGAVADPERTDTRFQVYLDRAGEHRWRLLVGARQIIADSGEGYATRREHYRDLRRVQTQAGTAIIEDLTGHFPRRA